MNSFRFALIVALLATVPVVADEPDSPGAERWRLGFGLGSTQIAGVGTTTGSTAGQMTGYRLDGGLRLFGGFWLDLGYRDLGTIDDQTTRLDPTIPGLVPADLEYTGTMLEYALRFEHRFDNGMRVHLRYGLAAFSEEWHVSAAGSLPPATFEEDFDYDLEGVGLAYPVYGPWELALSYDDYANSGNAANLRNPTQAYTLSVQRRF